jgi:hypothetical protein
MRIQNIRMQLIDVFGLVVPIGQTLGLFIRDGDPQFAKIYENRLPLWIDAVIDRAFALCDLLPRIYHRRPPEVRRGRNIIL